MAKHLVESKVMSDYTIDESHNAWNLTKSADADIAQFLKSIIIGF